MSHPSLISLSGWLISVVENAEHNMVITISHEDKTPISFVEDLSNENGTFGERFTTEGIESKYRENGDPEAESETVKTAVLNYTVSLICDEDNHLNVFVDHDADGVLSSVIDGGDEINLTRTFKEIK